MLRKDGFTKIAIFSRKRQAACSNPSMVGRTGTTDFVPGRIRPNVFDFNAVMYHRVPDAEEVRSENATDLMSEYPLFRRARVSMGRSVMSLSPTGVRLMPSKSEPSPTWSAPAMRTACAICATTSSMVQSFSLLGFGDHAVVLRQVCCPSCRMRPLQRRRALFIYPHPRDSRLAEIGYEEGRDIGDHRQATAVCDGTKLFVGQVAVMAAQRAAAGMRCEERVHGCYHDIPERAFPDMRDVD
jgi:hypothetical protein